MGPLLKHDPSHSITDSSALTWLFKIQALSAKYHRWALRLTVLDTYLEWRPGVQHQLAHALPRAPHTAARGDDVDDSFTGDRTRLPPHWLSQGPILDGVPLSLLGVAREGKDGETLVAALTPAPMASLVVLAAVIYTPQSEPWTV